MRLSHLVIVLALAAFGSSAYAGQPDCGEKCNFHKHSPGTGLKPAIRDQVCFRFVQDGTNFVTATLYDVYAGEKSPLNHILRQVKHKKPDGERGQFCFGAKDWVSKSVWIDICNDINHSDRGIPSLTEGLRTGVVEMCLLGKGCPRYIAQQ